MKIFLTKLCRMEGIIKMKQWFQDEDINSLITAHNEWLASNGTMGKQLMLENARMCDIDFREVDFRKALLKDVTFKNSILDGATFISSNFCRVEFYKCSIEKADFSKSLFLDTTFKKCELDSAIFVKLSNLSSDIKFAYCKMLNINFENSTLENIDFHSAVMRKANFSNTIIDNVDFRGADLTDAKFDNSSIYHTNFKSGSGMTTKLNNISWTNAYLNDTVKFSKIKNAPRLTQDE